VDETRTEWTYDFGVPYKSKRPLTEEEVRRIGGDFVSSGISEIKEVPNENGELQKRYVRTETSKNQELGYTDVVNNKELLNSYKTFHKKWFDEELEGTDEEVADAYYERMRHFDANLGSILKLSNQMQNDYYTEDERQALSLMYATWDSLGNGFSDEGKFWDTLLDYGEAAATDPFNYATMLSGGTAAAGTFGAKQLANAGLRRVLLDGAKRGAKTGAIQGTMFGAGQSVGRQEVKTELGRQEGVELGQLALDTAGGTLGGAVFGAAGGALANTIRKPPAIKTINDLKVDNEGNVILSEGQTIEDALSGINYLEILGNPQIKGEARQVARDNFLMELGDEARKRMQDATETGIKVSDETRMERGVNLMKKFKIDIDSDEFNFDFAINRLFKAWNDGEVKANDLADYGIITAHLETTALDRLRNAWVSRQDDAIFAAWDSLEKAISVNQGVGKQAGSALRLQSLRNKVDTATLGDFIRQMATNKNLTADDVAVQLGFLNDVGSKLQQKSKAMKLGSAALGAANDYWISNILSSFNTLFINTLGGSLHMAERAVIETGAGLMARDVRQVQAGLAQTSLNFIGLFQGLRKTLKSLATAENYIDPNVSYVDNSAKFGIGNRNFNVLEPRSFLPQEGESIPMYGANIFGNVIRSIGVRGMASTDELMKQAAFRGKLFSAILKDKLDEAQGTGVKGWKNAYKEAHKLASKTLKEYYSERAMGLEPTNKYAKIALDEARIVTFQNNYQQDLAGATGKAIGRVAFHFPLLRQIQPFIRTPSNILSHNFQRTPLLQMTSKELTSMLQSPDPVIRGKGEMILTVSTTFWASAIMLSMKASLQGPGSSDYRKQKTQETAGDSLPYSLEVDGERIQIRKGDPYAYFYMMIGALGDTFRYGSPEKQQQLFATVTMATVNSIMSKGTLTGLGDIYNAFNQGEDGLEKYAENRTKAMVPFARFVRDTLESDPEMLTNIGMDFEKLAKAGWYIEDPEDPFDRRRDPIFGTAMEYLPNAEMAHFPLLGIPSKVKQVDIVTNEINRLGMTIDAPAKLQDDVKLDKWRIKGDNGNRSLYDRYQELVGEVTLPNPFGKGEATLHEVLAAYIQSDEYQQLGDSRVITGDVQRVSGGKEDGIKGFIELYRTHALAVLKEEPGIKGHAAWNETANTEGERIKASSPIGFETLKKAEEQGRDLLQPLRNQGN
jgi:hypothetical protein